MHAGSMGEWWWDRRTGRVGWDTELERLFDVEPGTFGGTFEAWVALVHQDDRSMVQAEVQRGVDERATFRFDHRVRWSDGSIHWIEGLGDVTVDDHGDVVGAVGLAWDVDDRHRELDERMRLLEIERQARVRAEYLARVHDVLARSVDSVEILERITQAAVPDLADWCSAVLAVDRPRDEPLIVAAHADDAMRSWAAEVQRRFPYDADAPFGAAKVIRTGERELLTGLSSLLADRGDARDVLERADVESVVTMPIRGPLGVLGSLQLIRGRSRPPFADHDLALVEELAARSGAALHTSVLFARQATSRAALETLQRVSGWLARAATVRDVSQAVITHGVHGLDAVGAAVMVGSHQGLTVAGIEGVPGSIDDGALHGLAERAMHADLVTVEQVGGEHGGSGTEHTVLVAPLRILDRTTGALVFVFEGTRAFAEAELSMVVTLGSRCAGALERAWLYERERDTALVLQRRLLPDLSGVPSWLEAAARYEPATGGQIGGDWYQLVDVGDDCVMAVVGDAVGHGMASAAAMGQLRASIATAASTAIDPAVALDAVDRFAAHGADTLGATVALALIERSGQLRHASAGHPPPVLVAGGARARLLDDGRRSLLGFQPAGPLSPSASCAFDVGDTLVLYTDGLVERRHESLDRGFERLVDVVDELTLGPDPATPQHLCDALVERLVAPESSRDDVAVLVLRRVEPAG